MLKSTNLRVNAKIGLSNWINDHKWNLWTTLSTGYELTLPSTRRAMIRFHEKVSKTNPCQVFWASEKFDVKDGFHLHTLWKFQNEIYDKATYGQFVNDWRSVCKTKQANVYSKSYKMNMGAHEYISKYITKQCSDYDYFDANSGYREKINDDVMRADLVKRKTIAMEQISKACRDANVNFIDVKNEVNQKWIDEHCWYEDIESYYRQENRSNSLMTFKDENKLQQFLKKKKHGNKKMYRMQ